MNPINLSSTFSPDLSDIYGYIVFGIALLLAGIGIAIWAFRLPTSADKRLRLLVPYAGFIMGIIALMIVVGNVWQLSKYPTIKIEYPGMYVNDEPIQPLPNRSAWRVEREKSTPASWGKSQNILLMRVKDGTTYALPEDRYELPMLLDILRKSSED
ncbi:MAG: hypothetical protein AAFO91_12330 [Bacteroidota bacterium]